MRQIVLDTETTGLEPTQGHRIIEVGCVELVRRRITGQTFHAYFNPQRLVEPGALAVHGISNEFLKDKPFFKDKVEELLTFIKGAELIIHNAAFDIGFLNHEFKHAKKNLENVEAYCQVLDTLLLARQLHPGQKNNLDVLCKRYQIDNTDREYHGALKDAKLLARVYLAMTRGGQGSLFDQEELTHQSAGFTSTIQEAKGASEILPSPVIYANANELLAHEEYVRKLNEYSKGKCLWNNRS